MARDTVLVVGAGASFGARMSLPAEKRPPFGANLAGYLRTWFDANSEDANDIHWIAKMQVPSDWTAPGLGIYSKFPDIRPTLVEAESMPHPKLTSFEAVMEKLLVGPPERGPDEPLDVERVNAIADCSRRLDLVNEVLCYSFMTGMSCAFEKGPDLYDELFSRLHDRLRAVITPNYDLLTEEALARVGLGYWYRSIEKPSPGLVAIDKFHGAANFFYTPGTGVGATMAIADANVIPTEGVMQKHGLSLHNKLGVHVARDRKQAVCELKAQHSKPVLVTYGPGKDASYGRYTLNQIRNDCAADLRENPPACVIAIGISPPRGDGDDDAWEDLCRQLGGLNCVREYWSGCKDEREKMGAWGFQGRDGYFQELLGSL